jgi:hypothetical protein
VKGIISRCKKHSQRYQNHQTQTRTNNQEKLCIFIVCITFSDKFLVLEISSFKLEQHTIVLCNDIGLLVTSKEQSEQT